MFYRFELNTRKEKPGEILEFSVADIQLFENLAYSQIVPRYIRGCLGTSILSAQLMTNVHKNCNFSGLKRS